MQEVIENPTRNVQETPDCLVQTIVSGRSSGVVGWALCRHTNVSRDEWATGHFTLYVPGSPGSRYQGLLICLEEYETAVT